MKLTIISNDKRVYKDGVSYEINSFDNAPINIHALQWDSQSKEGWIEFNNSQPNEVIDSLPDWANQLLLDWEKADYDIKNPIVPAPTSEQLLEKCKFQAMLLLSESDWAVLPDVGIKNSAEFITYRGILRGLVIQPQENPDFPVKPQAVWE